jgi:hypothetical protein
MSIANSELIGGPPFAEARGSEIARGGDAVNHPPHYTAHPSGVECIQVTEHMSFCLGNAVKYIWRADLKHDAIEDLRKAQWYLARELERRERHSPNAESEARR